MLKKLPLDTAVALVAVDVTELNELTDQGRDRLSLCDDDGRDDRRRRPATTTAMMMYVDALMMKTYCQDDLP